MSRLSTQEPVACDMQTTLTQLMTEILGPAVELRWSLDEFPFTEPSFQLEVRRLSSPIGEKSDQRDWVEILGCGIVKDEILRRCIPGENVTGWAFGLGLDRLLMLKCGIPHIRLLWDDANPLFMNQYKDKELRTFKPFSSFPSTKRDLSCWLPLNDEDAVDVLRAQLSSELHAALNQVGYSADGEELVQDVKFRDEFIYEDSSTKRRILSLSWTICYGSAKRTVENSEINEIQMQLQERLTQLHGWRIRGNEPLQELTIETGAA